MNRITRDDLDKQGVHYLRIMARDLGVTTSPTTAKKHELIELILDFLERSGKYEVVKEATPKTDVKPIPKKKGRPPKATTPVTEVIGEIFPDEPNTMIEPAVIEALANDDLTKARVKEPAAIEEKPKREFKKPQHKKVHDVKYQRPSHDTRSLDSHEKAVASLQYGDTTYEGVNQGVLTLIESGGTEEREGVLDIHPENYGFLRAKNWQRC